MHIYVYMPSCAGGRAVEDDMEEKDLCSSKRMDDVSPDEVGGKRKDDFQVEREV